MRSRGDDCATSDLRATFYLLRQWGCQGGMRHPETPVLDRGHHTSFWTSSLVHSKGVLHTFYSGDMYVNWSYVDFSIFNERGVLFFSFHVLSETSRPKERPPGSLRPPINMPQVSNPQCRHRLPSRSLQCILYLYWLSHAGVSSALAHRHRFFPE